MSIGFVFHTEEEIRLIRESGHTFGFNVGHSSMRLEGISKKGSHAVAATGSSAQTISSKSGPGSSGFGFSDTRRYELGGWNGVLAKKFD